MGEFYNGKVRTEAGIEHCKARWRARQRARHDVAMHFYAEYRKIAARLTEGFRSHSPEYQRAKQTAVREIVALHPRKYAEFYRAQLAVEGVEA